MSLLGVEDIRKSFKGLPVLQGVSLEVRPEQRHVVIGPNGAGKTTVLNCITGLIPIDSGSVIIGDREVSRMPAHDRVALGMARTFQKTNLFSKLTVEENLHLAITSRKPYRFRPWKALSRYRDLRDETEELLTRWDLHDVRERKVANLGYGEQRLLEIVMALATRPSILLLDEPTSGMSPAETARITELIQEMPRSVALLVIEHDMDVVFSVANYITVLHHGEIFTSGPPEKIRGDEAVKEIYFGGSASPHA
jgi:branched-chain amino acid transport system ATP-binding protein